MPHIHSSFANLDLPFELTSEDGNTYTVNLFECSVSNVAALWQVFQSFSVLSDDIVRDDYQDFLNFVLSPSTVILQVNDIGILYATDVVPGMTAKAHYLFWDRKSRGRHKVILAAMQWTMHQFGLHRVDIEIPRHAYAALHRAYALGLRLEGIRRSSLLHEGKWSDVFCFGVLADELNSDMVDAGKLVRTKDESGWYGLLKRDTDLMRNLFTGGIDG